MSNTNYPQENTGLTNYYYDIDKDEVKTRTFTPELLEDLETLVLEPIVKPSINQLEDFEHNDGMAVNISGLWYNLTTLDDIMRTLGMTENSLKNHSKTHPPVTN